MSYIRPGDRRLHYSDWSHRWLGGNGTPASDRVWYQRMVLHMARHEAGEESGVSQGRPRYEEYPE